MITTALIFFAVLTVLVLIHELGHYTVARIIGVHVEEFGLGLPPRIIGRKIKQTLYSLNWLPIGGFVKLAGEDDEQDTSGYSKSKLQAKRSFFWARSKKERSAILVAGVAMNFLLAWGITTGLLIDGVKEPAGKVTIEQVISGTPAHTAGLQTGDVISSILTDTKTTPVTTTKTLINTVNEWKGKEVTLTVNRNNNELHLGITPRLNPPAGQGALGVVITDLELKKYPFWEAPVAAFKITIERAWMMLSGIIVMLWKLITFKGAQADVAGPIGIAQVTGQAAKYGFRAVLDFMSILSLNLAVLNILPIPALDGGRLAFVFAEKILGRKIKPAFEKQTHQIGMLVLLVLVLLISIGDIMRLARGG